MVSVDSDALREFGREAARFIPDLVVMLRGVAADPRVPQSAKLEAAAALAYLVSPKNRLTNLIPVVGQLDDVAVLAFAFRRLVVGAGEPILREHWRGSDRAFQALIGASSALASPAGMVRRAKVVWTVAGAAFDRIGNGRGRAGALFGKSGPGGEFGDGVRVIDGEVIGRDTADSAADSADRGAVGASFSARAGRATRAGGEGTRAEAGKSRRPRGYGGPFRKR